MFKRLLYSFMVLIALASIALGLYRFFEANDAHSSLAAMDIMIEYDGARQYALLDIHDQRRSGGRRKHRLSD